MENKIVENMTNMEETMEFEEMAGMTESTGLGVGKTLVIGTGLIVATVAIVKLGRKLWADHKAKKAQQAAEHDFVEPSIEEVEAVTN